MSTQSLPRRLRVLVVENSQDLAGALTAVIAGEPDLEAVRYAQTGAEALERMRQGAADVLVLDLGLPDGSGFTVLESLRAEGLAARAVIYTGNAPAAVRSRAKSLGAACILKGGDLDALLAAIRAA